ncbi:AraC family transcriptional regulator [uncultured Sphaerochaeta sp.]|uniref:helix-turn-helix domain-containing protein n=1 Tax=uncultured Sphaerochaeta sp. TaxID=886478 RepID=UPI002A0A9EA9|nr:AraC family transcriptional regulator [uncultured Sphaerochaeta sp.]
MTKIPLDTAIVKLQEEYSNLDWTYYDYPVGSIHEKMYKWPGNPNEEILICVHKSNGKQELFHRHDFFYFNFTYKGQYDSISYKYDNHITIHTGELYAGQPFAGHALSVHNNQETIIIGVLIQRDVFFRSFLPMLSANSKLFHFFLDPSTKSFSDEFIHFKVEDDTNLRILLEMMIKEYAEKHEDTQNILKPLVLSFLMQVIRQYEKSNQTQVPERLSDQIVKYIGEHFEAVTLKDISKKFSYHPNYISNLLSKDIGKSFSQILLEQRMERAIILLKGSTLSIEDISFMIGYGTSSNFYKAFKTFYNQTPRKYLESLRTEF